MRVQSKKEIRVLRRQLNKAQREFERTGDVADFNKANALDDELFFAYYVGSTRR